MRVLLHVDHDLSLPGGVETHVRELATHLAARGHEVEIYGRPDVLPPFTMVSRVDPRRYDVFHHHDGPWPRGLDVGHRYVRTLHLCVAAKMAAYVGIGRMRTLVNPWNWRAVADERAACRRRGRLVAVAERVRRDFARWHGMDPGRARIVPNGAPFAPPRESRAALRARHGISEHAPVLLTIGRDDYVKGYGLLRRAWDRSGAAGRGAVWVTAGGAAPSRERDRIVTGPVPHEVVGSWIHAADLGALPSYYEGCSLALLEMLAGRLFSLSHDVGNASEVIRPGENGRVLPRSVESWSDAIAKAVERPPGRASIGLDDSFSWERVTERVESVYLEAAEDAAARR